jgi:hypothetical protein
MTDHLVSDSPGGDTTDSRSATAPLPLLQGEWAVWSTAMIRGAGFPAGAVDRLADEKLAELADRCRPAITDEFRDRWAIATERSSRELGDVARSSAFRLAVGWQNRRFLQTAVEPLLRQLDSGAPSTAKRRERELAVATYWQRYCWKNDSIGFFGPTAWATIDPDRPASTMSCGPGLTDRGTVYLERWPVVALARKLESDFDLRPWLRPRRSPLLRIDGGQSLDDLDRAVLAAADGTVTAKDLARRLCASSAVAVDTENAVFERLTELHRRRRLIWRLELASSLAAEDELLELLRNIDDPEIRAATVEQAEQLVEARWRVQRVWDDPQRLDAELTHLEQTFVELTGLPASRHEGQTYGGRTLAFLDCRRDVSLQFGADFVAALTPLAPVLDSLRWLTWRIRELLSPQVWDAYRAARQQRQTPAGEGVDVATLWTHCLARFGSKLNDVVLDAVAEFHRRWAAVLAYAEDQNRVSYSSRELETRVKEQFDAPGSGWDQARMSCPDVMLAAAGVDDVRQGRFTLVLGEVHAAMNSLDYASLLRSHRNPGDLQANLDATFPGPRLLPVLPAESRPPFTARSHPALLRDDDHRMVLVPHTPLPRVGSVTLAADATAHDRGGQILITTREGTEFDVFDLFAEIMKSLLLKNFDLLPFGRHRPRVNIDDMVLTREAWSVPASELDFARLKDAPERYVRARDWARDRGLPRYVFVKSPSETKPIYVDFASPVFVDMLASCVRRAVRKSADGDLPALKFVEMMPGPGQTWLTGPDGETYTSEFRLAMYDLRTVPR